MVSLIQRRRTMMENDGGGAEWQTIAEFVANDEQPDHYLWSQGQDFYGYTSGSYWKNTGVHKFTGPDADGNYGYQCYTTKIAYPTAQYPGEFALDADFRSFGSNGGAFCVCDGTNLSWFSHGGAGASGSTVNAITIMHGFRLTVGRFAYDNYENIADWPVSDAATFTGQTDIQAMIEKYPGQPFILVSMPQYWNFRYIKFLHR